MNIKTKLLTAFMATTLLPVLIVSLITINNVTQQAKQDFEKSSQLQMALVDQSFQTFFTVMGYNVSMLADHPSVQNTNAGSLSKYFGPGRKPSEVAQENGGREQDIFQLFSSMGENNPMLGYVYMGAEDGGYLEWPGTADYGDWDPRRQPWFSLGQEANFEIVRRDGYYWEPDDAVYVSILKGYRNSQGSFGGIAAIDVSLKSLTDMVQDIRLGDTGYLILIEGSGKVLVDGGNVDNNFKSLSELQADYYRQIETTEAGIIEVEVNGQAYMANVYQSPSLGWKFVGLVQEDEIFSSAGKVATTTTVVAVILIAAFSLLGIFIANRIVTPINLVKDNLKTIAQGEGDLTARIDVVSKDETGELATWFNQFIESIRGMINEIKSTAIEMEQYSKETTASANNMAKSSSAQLESLDQIVTAATQMASTASEVAKNCAETATVSENGLEATEQGRGIINRSVDSVGKLGESIASSNGKILELEKETGNINNILATIQDIAEQTNLLALNAAIEAARAGEQGRGFAVVADEVRNLAKRTQDSTEEINSILNQLVERTKEVSATMEISGKESGSAMSLSSSVLEAFDDIGTSVEKIRDMATQIATAAEEQHLVTEDINKNIVTINGSANEVAQVSQEVEDLSAQQANLSQRLTHLVTRFKTE